MADNQPRMYSDPVPVEISVFFEGGQFVFRTDESQAIYFFDKDAPGKSNCDGACTLTWRPVAAPPGAKTVGNWTTIERPDKSWQWAFKGMPVYTLIHDQLGKATGDGAGGGLWHVVKP